MTSYLTPLIEYPFVFMAVMAFGATIGISAERIFEGQKRAARRVYWKRRNAGRKGGTTVRLSKDAHSGSERVKFKATDQLACVMDADFAARPLLNGPETNLFKALDAAVIARNPKWQVMAQVCLGEFLMSTNKDAFSAVNAKRVDFALMDPEAHIVHAIEYQGTGHHLPGSVAAARDAVKKEALRKAGIGYHEVVAGHMTAGELRRLVEKLVPSG